MVRQALTLNNASIRDVYDIILKREAQTKIALPLLLARERFSLNEFEYVCLILSVSFEMDGSMGFASFKIAQDLFNKLYLLSENEHNLFKARQRLYYLLSFLSDGQFRIRSIVYRFILEALSLTDEILALRSVRDVCNMPDIFPLEQTNIIKLIKNADKPVVIGLKAPNGYGKRTLAMKALSSFGSVVLLVNITKDYDASEKNELLENIISISILSSAMPIISFLGRESDFEGALKIAKWTKVVFLCGNDEQKELNLNDEDVIFYDMELKRQGVRLSFKLWEYALKGLQVDTVMLSERYSLTALQIASVAKRVKAQKACNMLTLSDMDAVTAEIAKLNKGSSLAKLKVPAFDLDSLIVEDMTRKRLEDILAVLRLRQRVYSEFGYDKLFPYGRGLGILFYGASGTGKTMAAFALAKELGLDVLVADISRIIDKYIGETEKHLNEIFDTAKQCNCILFFDEADSLFAKRTDVTDSFDRSANAQTAHLLQKMEEYDGVVILATNLNENIDDAFKRRLPFLIEFQRPNALLRERLWRQFITPNIQTKDIDFDYLSNTFSLTPAVIKWTVFSSVVRAVSMQQPLTMEHILTSLSYEYEKMGVEFPSKPHQLISWEPLNS